MLQKYDIFKLHLIYPPSIATNTNFSSYENNNTLKALVVITPSGGVCLYPSCTRGNMSDWELTQWCGLLSLLESGDSVNADRGFTIADLLDLKEVHVRSFEHPTDENKRSV